MTVVHVGIGRCELSRISLGAPAAVDLSRLSPRELQVLRLVAAGHRLKAIGYELSISQKTVSVHKSRIKEKLRIASDVEWMALLRALPSGAPPR